MKSFFATEQKVAFLLYYGIYFLGVKDRLVDS